MQGLIQGAVLQVCKVAMTCEAVCLPCCAMLDCGSFTRPGHCMHFHDSAKGVPFVRSAMHKQQCAAHTPYQPVIPV